MHPIERERLYDVIRRYISGEKISHENMRIFVAKLFESEQAAREELSELEQEYAELFNEHNKYRHVETGQVVTALDWAKEKYLDTRKDLIRLGEIDENEGIPSEKEFIEQGILELDADEEYERI